MAGRKIIGSLICKSSVVLHFGLIIVLSLTDMALVSWH